MIEGTSKLDKLLRVENLSENEVQIGKSREFKEDEVMNIISFVSNSDIDTIIPAYVQKIRGKDSVLNATVEMSDEHGVAYDFVLKGQYGNTFSDRTAIFRYRYEDLNPDGIEASYGDLVQTKTRSDYLEPPKSDEEAEFRKHDSLKTNEIIDLDLGKKITVELLALFDDKQWMIAIPTSQKQKGDQFYKPHAVWLRPLKIEEQIRKQVKNELNTTKTSKPSMN